ncbi:unnamed protein product [Dibothriocephalus latus]|uniref:Uncharacterized protein n=1 Tax=Dibothriocephalus latus TaxID=60516 RepID=A0A3P7RFZ4_DIBLA|nr:unnamed protein product [Dibothriocephalus latus]
MTGHTNTVSTVRCQESDPQVITGSHDATIRLWDLATGRTMCCLTNHKKSVRSVFIHPTQYPCVWLLHVLNLDELKFGAVRRKILRTRGRVRYTQLAVFLFDERAFMSLDAAGLLNGCII